MNRIIQDEILPIRAYLDINRAREFLANHLEAGTLALLIGSGASADLGLPNWKTLVCRCAYCTGVDFSSIRYNKNPSSEQLLRIMDRVERSFSEPTDYFTTVQRCLYRRIKLDVQTIQNELLTALGALLMRSRRGSVSTVLTFNFDNMLEWYLRVHGYDVKVITDVPTLLGAEDVHVWHVQGYLPHPRSNNDFGETLIFSKRAVDERIGKPHDPWKEVFREVFLSKIVLAIGLSEETFGDRFVSPIITNVHSSISHMRPTGFWIFGHPLTEEVREDFISRNVVPLEFPDYKYIPRFLLSICQEAAGQVVTSATNDQE